MRWFSTAEVLGNRHKIGTSEAGYWQTPEYRFYYQKPGLKQVHLIWMSGIQLH